MPVYVYRCQTCGEQFEKMVRFSEANQIQECPDCNSQQTQKLLTSFATQAVHLAIRVAHPPRGGCGGSGRFT